MGVIEWIPIADLPMGHKDGRYLLLWNEGPNIGQWHDGQRWWDSAPGWIDDGEGGPIDDVTHFAEITPPI